MDISQISWTCYLMDYLHDPAARNLVHRPALQASPESFEIMAYILSAASGGAKAKGVGRRGPEDQPNVCSSNPIFNNL